MSKKPMLLCIMDGFGRNDSDYGNAIHAARTPNLTRLFSENPLTWTVSSPQTNKALGISSVCPVRGRVSSNML